MGHRGVNRPSAVFVAIFMRLISSDAGGSVSLQLRSAGAPASSGGKMLRAQKDGASGGGGRRFLANLPGPSDKEAGDG